MPLRDIDTDKLDLLAGETASWKAPTDLVYFELRLRSTCHTRVSFTTDKTGDEGAFFTFNQNWWTPSIPARIGKGFKIFFRSPIDNVVEIIYGHE